MSSMALIFSGFASTPPLSDHESQKFTRGDPEGALGGIQFHSVLPESCKGFLQIFDVLFSFSAFDQHVVNINLHVATDLVLEDFIDQSLVGS